MTTDEYSGMSRQDLRMEVIHWRGRAEVSELHRGELGKLCGEVEKRAEGVASIPEPLRDQLRAAAAWAALPTDPDKCIASRQAFEAFIGEVAQLKDSIRALKLDRDRRLEVLAKCEEDREELEEDRKEWRERERFLETRTRELEDAMLELDKLLDAPTQDHEDARQIIATALASSGRSRESQGLMAELIVVRRHVHDLNADREELRRLLLDVAKFGVTAEALEAFRRAVGDPEWEP